MPVKRRLDKRRNFDEYLLEDQFYGPGSCLFNGTAYLAPYKDGFFRDKSEAVQAAVLEEMRADWERHSESIMAAWHARTPHQLKMARDRRGGPELPWAATEFAAPRSVTPRRPTNDQ